MKRIALSALAAVGVMGCGNTFFPLASDQLFETQLRATCSFAFNCCEAIERSSVGISQARDEGSCVEEGLEEGGSLAVLGQRAKAAVDAGTAVYDGELAERCLRPQLDAAKACDPEFIGFSFDAECNTAFSRAFVVGQVKDGDDCIDSLECADDGDCIVDDEGDTITIAGTCQGRAGEGDDCSERTCQAGLSCDFSGETPTCEKPVLLDDGESCFGDASCSSGNCVEVATGTCIGTDEACTEDADCDNDFCSVDTDNVCAPAGEGPDSDICNGRE